MRNSFSIFTSLLLSFGLVLGQENCSLPVGLHGEWLSTMWGMVVVKPNKLETLHDGDFITYCDAPYTATGYHLLKQYGDTPIEGVFYTCIKFEKVDDDYYKMTIKTERIGGKPLAIHATTACGANQSSELLGYLVRKAPRACQMWNTLNFLEALIVNGIMGISETLMDQCQLQKRLQLKLSICEDMGGDIFNCTIDPGLSFEINATGLSGLLQCFIKNHQQDDYVSGKKFCYDTWTLGGAHQTGNSYQTAATKSNATTVPTIKTTSDHGNAATVPTIKTTSDHGNAATVPTIKTTSDHGNAATVPTIKTTSDHGNAATVPTIKTTSDHGNAATVPTIKTTSDHDSAPSFELPRLLMITVLVVTVAITSIQV